MKFAKNIKYCAVLCLMIFFALPQTGFAKNDDFANFKYQDLDLADTFNSLNGSVVFYTPSSNTFEIFNKELAAIQNPPQSTFKIISTLIGLENGVINDEKSQMQYDGTKYWLDAWNKNVTLKEAFQSSCVWYYHQLIYSISQEKINCFLQKLQYGNEDTSQWRGNKSNIKDELNGFWLSSSLKISPLEQVKVLASIFESTTAINEKYISILKNIMRQKVLEQEIYVKTGSNMKGMSWFVGFIVTPIGNKYFAFFVDDPRGGISGAKNIATSYFSNTVSH